MDLITLGFEKFIEGHQNHFIIIHNEDTFWHCTTPFASDHLPLIVDVYIPRR
jgi:hypothetical protein